MTQEVKEVKPLSRSEREAKLKDKSGMLITVLAALLAVNTYISSGTSSKILNNTIKANDTWNFYQAKSIKQTLAEGQLDDAIERKDTAKIEKLKAKIARYDSEPATGEGKKELMAKARNLEAERDEAKLHSPWLTWAGMIFQLSIVLLSASILAVSDRMYKASIVAGTVGAIVLSQAIWLWIPV